MKWLRQFKFIIQFANKIYYFLNGDFNGSKLIRLETKSTSGCPINEAISCTVFFPEVEFYDAKIGHGRD